MPGGWFCIFTDLWSPENICSVLIPWLSPETLVKGSVSSWSFNATDVAATNRDNAGDSSSGVWTGKEKVPEHWAPLPGLELQMLKTVL